MCGIVGRRSSAVGPPDQPSFFRQSSENRFDFVRRPAPHDLVAPFQAVGCRRVAVWLSKVGVSCRRNSIFEKKVSFRVDETTSPSNRHRSKFRCPKNVAFRVDETHFFLGGQVWAGTMFGKCQFYEAFSIVFS